MGEEKTSKWLPKMICGVSCIFKISLCQCACKGISSTALFTIILEMRFFRTHLSSFYLIVRNLLIFDAPMSMSFFFFFFTKNSDIAFKIFESHAEEYCIVGNCAGIRWLTLLICNNIMLHMSSSHFTWITWLKSTELLWFSAVLKQVSAKAKRPIDLFFFLLFFRYAESIFLFLWNTSI